MTLRGDQFDPAYMKLNPNAVVPTLVHDGQVITESSIILYYLDDAFPENPLMPMAPSDLVKVRMVNKFIDEYLHNSCMILTFATAFRPAFLRMSPPDREAQFSRSPIRKRAEYKRDVVEHGLDSKYVQEALQLSRLWDSHPGVGAWWERVRIRPSVQQTIFQRMTESDWFKSIAPDPWPKVRELLAA